MGSRAIYRLIVYQKTEQVRKAPHADLRLKWWLITLVGNYFEDPTNTKLYTEVILYMINNLLMPDMALFRKFPLKIQMQNKLSHLYNRLVNWR